MIQRCKEKCELDGVEGLTLRYDAPNNAHIPQLFHSQMSGIWSGAMEVRPAQEASRPVSFARLMVAAKLVIVYRSVRFIQGVCAAFSAVVCQA